MINVLSTNVISPLGFTTEQNYQAIKSGNSALALYNNWKNIPEPFVASLFTEEQNLSLQIFGFSRFESIVIKSVEDALNKVTIDVSSERTCFILSTTKANVEDLLKNNNVYFSIHYFPIHTAKCTLGAFGRSNSVRTACVAVQHVL